MQYILQALFVAALGIASFLFYKKASEIRRNILLGKDEDFGDNKPQRWKNNEKPCSTNRFCTKMPHICIQGFRTCKRKNNGPQSDERRPTMEIQKL